MQPRVDPFFFSRKCNKFVEPPRDRERGRGNVLDRCRGVGVSHWPELTSITMMRLWCYASNVAQMLLFLQKQSCPKVTAPSQPESRLVMEPLRGTELERKRRTPFLWVVCVVRCPTLILYHLSYTCISFFLSLSLQSHPSFVLCPHLKCSRRGEGEKKGDYLSLVMCCLYYWVAGLL